MAMIGLLGILIALAFVRSDALFCVAAAMRLFWCKSEDSWEKDKG